MGAPHPPFNASSGAIRTLAAAPKRLGADTTGFFGMPRPSLLDRTRYDLVTDWPCALLKIARQFSRMA